MPTRYMVYPYKQNSEGAIALADALDGKRILREGSRYQYRDTDVLINWGAGDCPYPQALNSDVKGCIEKREFFRRLAGSPYIPKFTLNRASALGALDFPIVCRTRTTGHDGEGIVIADNADQMVDARLYTQLVDKTAEYRVHIGRKPDGSVTIIGAQKKLHRGAPEGVDERVWVGEGTVFVWTVGGVVVDDFMPEIVRIAAHEVFDKFPELTFGAFDIVYHTYTSPGAVALEINSAPMMTPETARRYAEFFKLFATGE